MDRAWYARFGLIVVLTVAAWLAFWPSIGDALPAPEWLTEGFHHRIAPGLDIRGGMRLQYEVDVDQAIEDRRDVRAQQIIERLCVALEICTENEPPTHEQLQQTREHVRTHVDAASPTSFRVVFEQPDELASLDRDMVLRFGDLRESARTTNSLTLELRDEDIENLRDQSVQQARETIANRIDEMGTREASVMTRDTDIIVELPGATEEQFERVREIIARTARLEFKIVDDMSDLIRNLDDIPEGIERTIEGVSAGTEHPNVASSYLVARGPGSRQLLHDYVESLQAAGRIPDDHQIAIGEADRLDDEEEEPAAGPRGQAREPQAWRTYTLYRRAELTGDAIADAMVARNQQDSNLPYVSLTFNNAGAVTFGQLTGANVRRRMAIVLDDRVASAPVIQQRIGGGRCQITLGGARAYDEVLDEASQLVIVLRAGALPAPIRPSNEQVIGPTLGADSVRQGIYGALAGVLLVLAFMAVYYQTAGLVADLMVVLNILFLLAILAARDATLTLPGIAGIALTVGMAVDANVLINERIRDELRLGKSPRSAVELGFQRAFWAIFDSQLTTFIAGVVLFQFGTGPIRGFAVTLMTGIITSIFTGVFCSKVAFDALVRGLKVQRLRMG